MEKENRNLFYVAVVQFFLFLVFTIAVKFHGFEELNNRFYSLTGFHPHLKTVTDIMGYLSFVFVFFFAMCGLFQFINGKSLKSVDRKIIVLGFLYFALFVFYVVFNRIVISVRPDGSEASYPSSHTLLFICINVTAMYELEGFIKNRKLMRAVRLFLIICTVAGVFFRLLCGCHWLTDIFGSLLLASSLISFFFVLV